MFLIIFAALIAAGETAKLDRTYLPPLSAANAGGSPDSLQLPFSRSNEGSQGSQELPSGGFVNDHQGVVVEAALAGTRASGLQSGLGGPRISYGSSDSKVGDAAFRVTNNRLPQGPANGLGPNGEPDLSAFYRPPSAKPGNIQIIPNYVPNTVKYQNNIGIDKFNYAFETDNGIKMSENGISRNGIQAQGGFSYTGDDGKVYSVVYTADKNGYRPTGNHLPTPPPIPAEILESLKQNARDEAAGLVDDGSYDAKKYNTENDYSENEANDKYNDRQSNKFGDRPVFAGGFINQNQQAFVTPNFNGQFGVNDVSKDSSFSKPDSSRFGSLMQIGNRFGSIQEPSKFNPNNLLSNKQATNQLLTSSNGAADLNFVAKPLSQQNLQEQKPFKKPFNRPSSYDTSNLSILSSSNLPSQPSSVGSFDSSYHGAYNYGSGNNRPSDQAFHNKPAQGPFILNTLSQGLPIENSSNLNTPFSNQNLSSTLTSSQPSTGYYTNKPTQQFPSFNIQSSQSGRLPGSQFSSLGENSIQPLFATPLKPAFPTKHPSTTLTTPLESSGASNEGESLTQANISESKDLDNTKTPVNSQGFTSSLSQSTPNISEDSFTSYTGSQTSSFNLLGNRFSVTQATEGQDSSSFKQPSDDKFSSNTQKPSYEFTQFIQSQAPDHSYVYNRPNKPFDTPFVGSGSISTSSSNGQVTPLLPQTSFFTNAPQTSISSNKNEDIMRPQSFDSNRFTEASISTFPSTVSVLSSKLNNRPSFNIQNESSFLQVNPTSITATAQASAFPNSETVSTQGIQETQSQDENTSVPLQENIKEIYQYPKPTEGFPSQTQEHNMESGQENSVSTDSPSPQFNEFGSRKPTTQQSSFSLTPQSQFVQGSTLTSPSQPQFGHENFTILSKKPEQTFGFQSRPQLQEIDLFGNKGQNLNLASQLSSKPITSASSFSQGTTSDMITPSVLSQTGQETSFKPTEQPTTQNTQSTFDNKEITMPQLQESSQPSISPFDKPFGINTQRPLGQFGQQSSFFSRRPTTQPVLPVISQFPSLTSKFGNKPTSLSTQFGVFNTQNQLSEISEQSSFTSKKPFSQTSPINTYESTQFNEGTLNNKQTPTFEHAVDRFDDKHSTSLPSSTQFQTGSFDTQRPSSSYLPTQTQFDQSSFSITSLKPSSQSQFGSQQSISSIGHGSFNNKISTFSQFDQSTQKFGTHFENKLSTQKPSSFQTQFNDYNKETTNTQFTLPATANFDQFISTNQPSQPSTLFTGQFGQENESKTTSAQFDTKQQSTTFNEPSTLISSTSEFQTPTQNTEFGLINGYKKPAQGLITSSQKQDKPQFQITTQFGQQSLSSIQKEKPAQFTQTLFNSPNSQFSTTNEDKIETVTQQHSLSSFPSTQDNGFSTFQNTDQSSGEIYEYNKPSTEFGQQGILNIQKEKPAQFTKPIFNSQFTTNEDKTESVTQENVLIGFPSTPEVSSSTLQNSGQNNGEIYELNYQFGQQGILNVQKDKPALSLFNFSNSQYNTNIDKTESVTQENILTGFSSTQEDFSSTSQNTNQSTGEIYEYNKPEQSLSTSSETDGTTQSEQKIQTISNVNRENLFTNPQTTSQFGQTTFNVDNKNTDDLTSTTSEGTTDQPRPQLAFHNACCGGLFKKPLGSHNSNPPFNIFDQNKGSISDQKLGQVQQSIDKLSVEPVNASSFTGTSEKFPSSRKPPSFDETGYHY